MRLIPSVGECVSRAGGEVDGVGEGTGGPFRARSAARSDDDLHVFTINDLLLPLALTDKQSIKIRDEI